jgi:signal transduction histidine kinase
VSIVERGDEARIRVHNEGAPIPPDVRATLFHPFSTYGKRGGTGLGIYGVKMAVEAMGGRVDCETGAKGTVFEIVFPTRPSSRGETA